MTVGVVDAGDNCTSAHCINHGTGTTTCVNHRSTCSTNRVLTFSDFVQGGTITASQVEELRTKIRDELARYNLHANYNYTLYQSTAVASGQTVTNEVYNNLNDMIRQAYGSDINKNDGDLIDDANWDSLISYYNVVRQNCICNTDCSCNNVCACHNDCDCNYSDERLKENIIRLGVKNGLNIYSYNYIWDRVKRTGVMAQEVLQTQYKDAVTTDVNGYYMVNYSRLPI